MRLLERMHLPSVVGALLVILLVIGSLVGLVAALSVPAATWAERLPEGIPRLEAHLAVLKAPIEALQKVIQQAEQVADSGTKGSVVRVHRDLGLTGALFEGTRAVLDGLFTTVLVLYFLLVSGDIFLRRIVEVLPKFKDKRQAVDISQQIEEDISAYLVTITVMNAAVGVATATAMYLCGLGDPLLWGVTLPTQLHSDIGTAIWNLHLPSRRTTELRHLIMGFVAAGPLPRHPPRRGRNPDADAASAALHFEPSAGHLGASVLVLDVGRGAILAVPLLAMVKIVCDRVLSLKILCIAERKPA